MSKEKEIQEWAIFIALFKATVEQQSMLIGTTKHNAKVIFKRWLKEGNNMLKLVEGSSNIKALEEITEVIEDGLNKLRV